MAKKITIAVDGYSSTGKSTLAKQLAQALEYIYVDSGAMYRAVTYYAMQNNAIKNDVVDFEILQKDLYSLRLHFQQVEGNNHIFLNGKDVEKAIRSLDVSNAVSLIAKIPEVRAKLVQEQQALGAEKGVVMDGRDIGTVVFPNAELKIFMTASAEVRTERRYRELLANGEQISKKAVRQNLEKRDYLDTTRKDSPLIKAQDAVEIDNSYLSREEQLAVAITLATDRIALL